MPAANKDPKLSYKVTKIQTTRFLFEEIDENELKNLFNTPDSLNINLNVNSRIDAENSSLIVEMNSDLIRTEDELKLVQHSARTSFYIENLHKNTYDEKKNVYNIPDGLVIQVYGIAYTHARALVSVELSPTVYRDKYFLPVIDPAILIPPKKEKNTL